MLQVPLPESYITNDASIPIIFNKSSAICATNVYGFLTCAGQTVIAVFS